MKKNLFLTVALAITTLAFTSCQHSQRESCELSGAGATFPEPFYTMAFDLYHTSSGHTVSYGGIGSGGGVRNLRDKVVDFAGSDAFLSDDELSKMDPVVHVPTCMGAVVLGYNLPEVSELRLSGSLVADIFAGSIVSWDDARIQALNPTVALPAKKIIPVFRSDGSGTTFVFTSYLSAVSEMWKVAYGAAKSVDFPTGQAAKGNPGVASVVNQTPYSIGYIGSEYAFAQQIPMAVLQNAQGEWVMPNVESISASATGSLPADTRTMVVNSSASGAYPISCFTWLLIYQEQYYNNRSEEQARATLDLLRFMLSSDVQQSAEKVKYAPLPQSMIDNSIRNLKAVTYKGKPLL